MCPENEIGDIPKETYKVTKIEQIYHIAENEQIGISLLVLSLI
jgi:hypothetical protein